jgi:hypothetical protein
MSSRRDDRRITIIVPKDVHLSLKLEAVKQETTVSDIVRELIDGWLDGLKTDTATIKQPSGS